MALEKIQSRLLNEKKENLKEKEQLKKSSRNSSLSHNSGGSYIPRYKMNPNFNGGNKENLKVINVGGNDQGEDSQRSNKKPNLDKSFKSRKANDDNISVKND